MELFKILGKVAIDNGEANEKLKETSEEANNTVSKMEAAFSKIGSAAAVCGQAIATGLAAGAAAMGKLLGDSISSYAEYEQLVGGVETLYGASISSAEEYAAKHGMAAEVASNAWEQYQNRQETVMQNAANAYKTAGISANEYMDTVNGFAASLTSSLGEYEWQAANYADMIITDMADNANKMGTNFESIQNAYSGFAKQNFTMLDNLKLGYGGTKEEMERLLRDAEQFAGYIKGSLSIDSFADVAEAINIVQTELGITGTTAKEASTTIQGSISSMKGAWTNFLTGMANENADFDVLLGNLVDSLVTVADNLIVRIQILLPRLVEGINQLITTLIPLLPPIIQTVLPGLIDGAVALVTGLIAALPLVLQILIAELPGILMQIGAALTEAFPALLETVVNLFSQIFDYISLGLLGSSTSFSDFSAQAQEVFDSLWSELQSIWDSVGQPIWDMVQSCIDTVSGVFSAKMPEIKGFVSDCFKDIKTFWESNLKPCFEAIGDFIEGVLAPIFDAVFTVAIGGVVETVFNTIKSLWEDTLKPVFTGITDFLTGVFTGDWDQALNGILDIASGVWNGIQTAIETPFEAAKNFINEGIDFIKDKFDFDWSFPPLKLPHFRINGDFSLNPPSVPEIGIDWYAKAMNNPMLMTEPTVFGFDAANGNFLAGGEKGAEVVSGANTLMNMIGSAVEAKTAAQNERIISLLSAILNAILTGDEDMLQAIREGHVIKLNNREVGRVVRSLA